MNISLNPTQTELHEELQSKFDDLKTWIFEGSAPRNDINLFELRKETAQIAHTLYKSLEADGNPPQHHPNMIKFRNLQPDAPEFYDNHNTIEDLLSYIENPDDAFSEYDPTLGRTFELDVFNRRRNSTITYQLTRTSSGWYIQYNAINGPCDPSGHPYLFTNLSQDNIAYPSKISDALNWLWRESSMDVNITPEMVQKAFNELSKWIIATEINVPSQGMWNRYF